MEKLTLAVLVGVALAAGPSCDMRATFADMHDGDRKEVTISGSHMTIRPSGNNQSWVVHTEVNCATGEANIDFDVPGKPSPPPVNLTGTLWKTIGMPGEKVVIEFTDPSGTIAKKGAPVNQWVELSHRPFHGSLFCADGTEVYSDMHDGDMKMVTLTQNHGGTFITIKPSGNNQTWTVHNDFSFDSCSAVIDFNVPGKPSPPPVKLTATYWKMMRSAEDGQGQLHKDLFEFTDPSGTLAAAGEPINHWVSLGNAMVLV